PLTSASWRRRRPPKPRKGVSTPRTAPVAASSTRTRDTPLRRNAAATICGAGGGGGGGGTGSMVRVYARLPKSAPTVAVAVKLNGVPDNTPPLARPGKTMFGPVALTVAVPSNWALKSADAPVTGVARMQLAIVSVATGVRAGGPMFRDRLYTAQPPGPRSV